MPRSGLRRIVTTAAAMLAAAAVVKEYRLPPEERTWHGKIVGIPYDFRRPTFEKLRDTLWNPNEPSLFPPQPFGVGWTLNLYRLTHMSAPPTPPEEASEDSHDG